MSNNKQVQALVDSTEEQVIDPQYQAFLDLQASIDFNSFAPTLKQNNSGEFEQHLQTLPTTSAKIRYLDSQRLSRGAIVKVMEQHLGRPIRYQHIRNVLITPVNQPKV